ncbi:MAG: UDP-N-acetylmuramoyl-L-alanyl-D-glutamate--2,6-diaminopimelate ligase [Kiritimatiellae bacterium]|nr:UDP-N-acetylmuramoyl-L-alanyl-D-glutamate--2,6-diaminopimelate ligase [Kiritimatiellia bacterium]
MRIWGVTGTNGKTTTTWILAHFLGGGHVTTVEVDTGTRKFSTGYTTPPLPVLKSIFAEMERNGLRDCAMEVSSHAIHQRRFGDTVFAGCAFTNLTEDHLDYHKTMEAYFDAKLGLFRHLAATNPGAPAAICTDTPSGKAMFEAVRPLDVRAVACGVEADAESPVLAAIRSSCPLAGRYNEQNVLLAAALARAGGVPESRILAEIPHLTPRWGRLERVATKSAAEVFVDFAHTDDALANVLSTVKEFTRGKLWAVFGAGGDRDPVKRPKMGAAAARFADELVVTSDNPRSEDPEKIIAAIMDGVPPTASAKVEPDRRAAIRWALSHARTGDVVVICGKGHETTQEVKGVKHPFDDRVEAAAYEP